MFEQPPTSVRRRRTVQGGGNSLQQMRLHTLALALNRSSGSSGTDCFLSRRTIAESHGAKAHTGNSSNETQRTSFQSVTVTVSVSVRNRTDSICYLVAQLVSSHKIRLAVFRALSATNMLTFKFNQVVVLVIIISESFCPKLVQYQSSS